MKDNLNVVMTKEDDRWNDEDDRWNDEAWVNEQATISAMKDAVDRGLEVG